MHTYVVKKILNLFYNLRPFIQRFKITKICLHIQLIKFKRFIHSPCKNIQNPM